MVKIKKLSALCRDTFYAVSKIVYNNGVVMDNRQR